jgi:UDP-N-acetylmuramate dehydrogenase
MINSIENINLRPFNTMRIDSHCPLWVEFDDCNDAPAAVQIAEKASPDGRYLIVGGGSNLLFCKDYDGAVIHPAVKGWEAEAIGNGSMRVTVGAGVDFDYFIASVCAAKLWGLENLSLIPGTVGGAAVQNAGAYGVESGDHIESVYVWDTRDKKFDVLIHDDLHYGYRTSVFKSPENAGRYIVLKVTFILSTQHNPVLDYGPLKRIGSESATPDSVRNEVIAIRNSKLPSVDETGSAGSFFKNPVISPADWPHIVAAASRINIAGHEIPHFLLPDGNIKIPAAWLIEKAGWKGKQLGNAAVWPIQPLIIINATGHASASEILDLENAITRDVNSIFGIILTPEVVHI